MRALADAIAVVALVVMLIAASNVVGILLARGLSRSAELAVRQALGASGRRLVAQLLTESLFLGVAAGLAGLIVAYGLLAAYRAVSPSDVVLDVSLDHRALVYTLAVCGLAGLLVGLAPARQALHLNVLSALGAPGAGTPQRIRRRVRYGSVVPQLALSVALLVIAGAHARTLADLELRSPGFRTDHIETIWLKATHWADQSQPQAAKDAAKELNRLFFSTVTERIGALPGVSAAALCSALPSQVGQLPAHAWVSRDRSGAETTTIVSATFDRVSAAFFRVFDIRLVAGRVFDDHRDTPQSPRVALVNETLARQLAPDGTAIGREVAVYSADPRDPTPIWYDVVGVVTDTKDGAKIVPLVYIAATQVDNPFVLYAVARASTDPLTAALTIRQAIVEVDPKGIVSDVETIGDVMKRADYARRLTVGLVAFGAGFGMLLATIGLYSAVSYWTAQQARDLGVRATLGASENDLIRLVVWDGAKTVLMALVPGLLLGLLGFRLTARLLGYVLGPVSAPDLGVMGSVIALVTIVTMLACYVPARRAASADPLLVLRS